MTRAIPTFDAPAHGCETTWEGWRGLTVDVEQLFALLAPRGWKVDDEREDWYAAHREDCSWLIAHGDPQRATFDLLASIPCREVLRKLLTEAIEGGNLSALPRAAIG